MALPTLRPSWVKKFKTSAELTSRKTQKDIDFRSEWFENYKYFSNAEACALNNQKWTSDNSYKQSMEAVDNLFAAFEINEKKESLDQRRKKLQEILAAEDELFQKELKTLRCERLQLPSMQKRVDELNRGKEEGRKQLAERKMHEHWKKNEPSLRKLDTDRHQKLVIKKWDEQLEEKEASLKTSQENERRLVYDMELRRQMAEEKQTLQEMERKTKEKQISEALKQQISFLKEREKEGQLLKEQEEILVRNDMLLQKSEERRKALERNKMLQHHGMILIRQYKDQIKRKSRQVQEGLELDLEILQEIAEKEKEELEIKSACKENLKADAEYMKKVIEDQLIVEKTREAQLDMLYKDEGARQWRKREAEWEREQLARERLMKSVLDERQQQIQAKLENVHLQKEQSIAERERLIEEMEDDQRRTQREQSEDYHKRREQNDHIHRQILSKEQERERQKRAEIEELHRDRDEEERYNLMLQNEAQVMHSDRNLAEPSFRRRKIAFT